MPRPAPTQFSGVFLSYRRDDSAGHAGRLFDRLSARFGEDQVFIDIDHIEPGEDFVQVIEDAVGSCEVLLTVIGRRWLLTPDGAARRLDNPNDFVRLEIAAALRRNIRVIPVLVEGATMPGPQDLPDELSHFTRRHAIELSDQRWGHDVNRLVATLEKVFAERKEARLRAEREEEERQRHALAEEQRRREEERSRQEAEERRKLEEKATVTTHATEPWTVGRRSALAATVFAAIATGVAVMWWAGAGGEKSNTNDVGLRPEPGATASQTPKADTRGSQTPAAPAGQSAAGVPATPDGMVYVPGGKFTMGRDGGDVNERPAHVETVGAFFIDVYEMTCGVYENSVRESGRPAPRGWEGGACPAGARRKPATGVTWDDADAFCRARGKRLPTEAEWEFAARGTDGRRYPWGNAWRAGLANADGASDGVVDVGSYPEGKSPFGVFDMAGNAWEWTSDELLPYRKGKRVGRLLGKTAPGLKVIRGCMHECNKGQATTTYRRGWPPSGDYDYSNTGFRCAKDAEN